MALAYGPKYPAHLSSPRPDILPSAAASAVSARTPARLDSLPFCASGKQARRGRQLRAARHPAASNAPQPAPVRNRLPSRRAVVPAATNMCCNVLKMPFAVPRMWFRGRRRSGGTLGATVTAAPPARTSARQAERGCASRHGSCHGGAAMQLMSSSCLRSPRLQGLAGGIGGGACGWWTARWRLNPSSQRICCLYSQPATFAVWLGTSRRVAVACTLLSADRGVPPRRRLPLLAWRV